MTATISTIETRVAGPEGELFVQRWQPDHQTGSPIVLFHDSLGSVSLWRDFPAALASATGREVIAYDRLGFGQSDSNPQTLDPKTFVADEAQQGFAALVDGLGLVRFVLFGHSVGGAMAAVCAARFNDRCDALITESAQGFTEELTLQGIREAKANFAQPGQVDRLKRYHGDKAEWVLSAWIDSWLSADFADWTLEGILPDVTCPVLSIHGDHDEFGSLAHPAFFTAKAQGPGTVKVLEGVGHVPHREDAATVLEIVSGFLSHLSH